MVLLATRSRAPPERKSAGSRLSPAKAETEAVRVCRAGPACSWGCARCRRVAWGGSDRVGSVATSCAAGTCASWPLPIPSFSRFFLPLVSFILSHPLFFPFLFSFSLLSHFFFPRLLSPLTLSLSLIVPLLKAKDRIKNAALALRFMAFFRGVFFCTLCSVSSSWIVISAKEKILLLC